MIVLRVAYDGQLFQGTQRQPVGRSVETALIDSLRKVDAFDCMPKTFRMASRTDKGVSAWENYLFTDIPIESLLCYNRLDRINKSLQGAWVTGYGQGTYRPPFAKRYSYYLASGGIDPHVLKEACSILSGTHDYTNFSKPKPDKEPVRTISVDAVEEDGIWKLIFSGKGFLWQLCRKIATACLAAGRGEMGLWELERLLDPSAQGYLSPADPCHLVLTELRVGIPCTPVNSGIERMSAYYEHKKEVYTLLSRRYSDTARYI